MIKVKRALISVFDKTGLLDFAKGLQALGVEILSTGGTAKALREAGLKVVDVSEYTGFPELLDGRVKTLHPLIHGGLLALRDNPEHMSQVQKNRIGLIDMAVVNLYPFERVTQKKNVSLEEAIENIDIGGPALIRSAAKNYKSVAVLCNVNRYKEILKELDVNSGILSDRVLISLALEAFNLTSRYDSAIYNFLNGRLRSGEISQFPKDISFRFTKVQDLRYGENPHQAAAFYRDAQEVSGLAKMSQLHGKELSFNNILDLNAAVALVKDFSKPTAVIVKHNNPTGIAEDKSLSVAYKRAFACDPLSAFGGIIGFNKAVDEKTAQAVSKSGFMECVIAPDYDSVAFRILLEKKNLRVIKLEAAALRDDDYDLKKVHGGILIQEWDRKALDPNALKVVTKNKPTKAQMESLLFGWKVVKHVRSNAIVLIKDTRTVGIGCGQTSRVGSAETAIQKAGKNARGSFLISDAFLPKPDTVKIAVKAGVKIIMQPGGSIADDEVIKEADKAKLVMMMTGIRHFKH